MHVNSLVDVLRKAATLHLQRNGDILLLHSSLLVPNKHSQPPVHRYWVVAFDKHTSVTQSLGTNPKAKQDGAHPQRESPARATRGFPLAVLNAERSGSGRGLRAVKGLPPWGWRMGERQKWVGPADR